MKVSGNSGGSKVQLMSVRQGFPLSPTLFGIFFDGLHEHMRAVAAEAGLLLGSGCQVPFLCNADDVVLHSDDSQSLQHLIDSMPGFASA